MKFLLHRLVVGDGLRAFPGTLDEVGYWELALSAADIAALFADGKCGLTSIRAPRCASGARALRDGPCASPMCRQTR